MVTSGLFDLHTTVLTAAFAVGVLSVLIGAMSNRKLWRHPQAVTQFALYVVVLAMFCYAILADTWN